MNDVYKLIMENVLAGKLEKEAAKQLIKALKQDYKENDSDIAIIGMSVKFPMADNIHEFWKNIESKVDCIGELSKVRKSDADNFFISKNILCEDINYIKAAYLKEIDKFDNKFFRVSPNEANLMDPCQRLFLEIGFEAIEDAGYGGNALKGSNTGVYVGHASDLRGNYAKILLESNIPSLEVAIPGNLVSVIPNRLSYFLDLKGPSMVIETGCSSSLVAIHTACKALINGECDMAVAGGVKIDILPLESGIKMGIEAKDGRTKAFDNRGDGTGIGEGVAAIVLKQLSKAIKDGDNIYAVIKGSHTNQDGSTASITVPNAESQKKVIIKAWENAKINPETISYIEAHGTGTKLGDPIEIDGIKSAFRRFTEKKQFCAVGSIKTNIGHLYECAGAAGLVKAIMALQHKEIPPMINFEEPNQRADFMDSPIYINTKLRRWETKDYPRRCGISSFGIGGTNCHVVLEEAPKIAEKPSIKNDSDEKIKIITLSAKNEHVLKELISRYLEDFDRIKKYDIEEICYTANIGRGHYNCRLVLLVKNHDELRELLIISNKRNLEELNFEKIYYGKHEVVSASKKTLGKGDITEETKMKLNILAKSKVNIFVKENIEISDLLKDICNLYIQGADIEWKDLYHDKKIRKVSIPVYPFERNRCWVKFTSNNKKDIKAPINTNSFYSRIRWIQKDLKIDEKSIMHNEILIFKDNIGLAEELSVKLKSEGKKVIEVEFGATFKKLDTNKYIITSKENNYERLLEELECENLSQIVHMSSISGEDDVNTVRELDEELDKGVVSLFLLVKAIGNMNFKHNIDIVVIGKNTYEITKSENNIKPSNASLYGLSKTISNEYHNLKCRCIDIDDSISCNKLNIELKNGQDTFNIAYRNGIRFVEEISSLNIADLPENDVNIKENGVYVITGGTGGIGMEICRYLSSKNKVKLVLINRSIFPERDKWDEIIEKAESKKICNAIKIINKIEKNGSEVLCYSEDVTNINNMKKVLDSVRQKYGCINGVIHGAGIAGDGFIILKKYENFKKVLLPKIHGTWILNNLTQSDNLDFFVMFSSEASVLGLPGQGDYTAANSYMDSFSEYRNKKGRKTLTINWPVWNETGLAVDNGVVTDTIYKSISIIQGIKAFDKILKTDIGRVIVGEWNYNEEILGVLSTNLSEEVKEKMKFLKNQFELNVTIEKKDFNVKLKGKKEEAYTETEKKIAQVWAEVLGVEELNIYDSFYELGGDSLLAFKLVNSINKLLNKNISIAEALSFKSVFDFANYLDESGLEEGKCFPVSLAQKRMFELNKIENKSVNCNTTLAYKVDGKLDINRLEITFNKIIERHEILRTDFKLIGKDVSQKICKELRIKVNYKKASCNEISNILKEFNAPFDLSKGPLFKVEVVELAQDKNLILVGVHGIIFDYISRTILIKELISIYEGNELMPLKYQYKDFVLWQNELLNSDIIKKQEKYWRNIFSGEIPMLNLPYDFPQSSTQIFEGDSFEFVIDKELTVDIRNLMVRTETNMYVMLLAAYNTLLYRQSGQHDIIVGIPISCRNYEEFNYIIGMFENTIAIRSYPLGAKRFCDLLEEVKNNFLKAYENKDYSLEQLIDNINIVECFSEKRLFNTKFSLINLEKSEINVKELKFNQYKINNKMCEFDFSMEVEEKKEELVIKIEYLTTIFSKKTIQKIALDFINIIKGITRNPSIELDRIEI